MTNSQFFLIFAASNGRFCRNLNIKTMSKKIVSLFAILISIACLSLSSCVIKEEVDHIYTIGAFEVDVEGSGFASALGEAEASFEKNFVITGKKSECDAEAKTRFDTAMVGVKAAFDKATDCEGELTYELRDMDDVTLASRTFTFR